MKQVSAKKHEVHFDLVGAKIKLTYISRVSSKAKKESLPMC